MSEAASRAARALAERLGRRVQGLGRALEHPGHLRRRLMGVRVDEELMALFARPYVHGGNVATVLDVGANEGQFARTALLAFPHAGVISFEPLPSAHAALDALAARAGGRVRVERFALGDREGALDFGVASFSPSSSALPPGADAEHLGDQMRIESTIQVPVRCLDAWAAGRDLRQEILLKLDVQGYELHVLRGATGLLRRVHLVMAEWNAARLYEGQPRLGDLCALLEPLGFVYCESVGLIRDPATGAPLWQDVVFARRS